MLIKAKLGVRVKIAPEINQRANQVISLGGCREHY
jgi:hypothetical protein